MKKTAADNQALAEAMEIAQFRFGLIAPVIQELYSDASRTKYCQRITEGPSTLPNGKKVRYNYKTVEKWASMYRKGGIDALMPRSRADKGSTRVLTDTAIEEIYRIKKEFPRLNATQVYELLVKGGYLPASVNVCTVQRFIRTHDLKSARDLNMRDRKAFEETAFGRMWQADTCYLPYITEEGKRRRVYVIMIIDDHSRLLVGGRLFYSDSASNFQTVFKDAVATYGIPAKLYVDNGSPYANEQLALICGAIGTVLIHTRPRDGASKAKIERSFRTLKERWLYGLDIEAIHSLDQFNDLLQDYIRGYNTTFHSGIRDLPLNRYLATKDQIRIPPSKDWLEECFLNRITRKVRKDSTVTIDGISYDVPMEFIGQKVEIRFVPSDMSTACIFDQKQRFPLRKTDLHENCRTKRNNPIDYSKIGGANT